MKNIAELKIEQKVLGGYPDLLKKNEEEMAKWEDTANNLNVEIYNTNQAMKELYEDVANDVIDVYKQMYQEQQDVALKAIDKESEALDKAHEKKMEQYDDELEKMQEIAQEKLDAIDKNESERDYGRELGKMQSEAQRVQDQINKLALDNSLEGKAKKAELEKELQELQENISEYQHDREVELRKEAISEELDAKKEQIDKEREIDNEKLEKDKEALTKKSEEISQYYEDLMNDERVWAEMREEVLHGNITNLQKTMGGFTTYLKDNMEEIGTSISQNLIDKIKEAQDTLAGLEGGMEDGKNTWDGWDDKKDWRNGQVRFKKDSQSYYIDAKGELVKGQMIDKGSSRKLYGYDEERDMYNIGANHWVKAKDVQKFGDGGYTGNWGSNEGKIAILHEKEQVLKADDTQNIFKAAKELREIGDISDIKDKLGGKYMPGHMADKLDVMKDIKEYFKFKPKIPIPKIHLPTIAPAVTPTNRPGEICVNVHIANMNGTESDAKRVFNVIGNAMKRRGI